MSTLSTPQSFWKRHAREIIVAALLALAIHDVFGPHGFLAMRRTQQELDQLRADIARLNQENGGLADQVTALKTDPKTIERIAREEMNLARPGEMIFTLPPENSSDPSVGKSQQTPGSH